MQLHTQKRREIRPPHSASLAFWRLMARGCWARPGFPTSQPPHDRPSASLSGLPWRCRCSAACGGFIQHCGGRGPRTNHGHTQKGNTISVSWLLHEYHIPNTRAQSQDNHRHWQQSQIMAHANIQDLGPKSRNCKDWSRHKIGILSLSSLRPDSYQDIFLRSGDVRSMGLCSSRAGP